MELRDAHVLITGASRSIGRALAQAFATTGARLSLCARTEADLNATAEETNGFAVVADLASRQGLAALLDKVQTKHGAVDVLINNAGVGTPGHFADMDEKELFGTLDINVVAPIWLTRQTLPAMIERRRGHIVNISSISAVANTPGLAVYAGSKAALTHFSEGLRMDLNGTGVGVTLAELGVTRPSAMIDEIFCAESYAPTRKFFEFMERVGMAPPLSAHVVANAVVVAVRQQQDRLVLPKRAFPMVGLPRASRALSRTMNRFSH